MIVDFRVRPPYKSFLDSWLYRPRDPNPDPVDMHPLRMDADRCPSFLEKSMPLFMKEMDEAGIDVGVIMGRQAAPAFGSMPNEEVAELVIPTKNFVVNRQSVPTKIFDMTTVAYVSLPEYILRAKNI